MEKYSIEFPDRYSTKYIFIDKDCIHNGIQFKYRSNIIIKYPGIKDTNDLLSHNYSVLKRNGHIKVYKINTPIICISDTTRIGVLDEDIEYSNIGCDKILYSPDNHIVYGNFKMKAGMMSLYINVISYNSICKFSVIDNNSICKFDVDGPIETKSLYSMCDAIHYIMNTPNPLKRIFTWKYNRDVIIYTK